MRENDRKTTITEKESNPKSINFSKIRFWDQNLYSDLKGSHESGMLFKIGHRRLKWRIYEMAMTNLIKCGRR